jgi:hypothetical protein
MLLRPVKQCKLFTSGAELCRSSVKCLKCTKMPKVPKIMEYYLFKAWAERSYMLIELYGRFHIHICEQDQNN